MASVNKVILIGNLGGDPELGTLPSGIPVARVSLATNERWKDRNGEQREEVSWHRLQFFDKLADVVGEYLHKGDPIYVEGRLKYGKYTDKDGAEKYTTDIVVSQMKMLGSKERDGAPAREQERRRPEPRDNRREQTPGQRERTRQQPSRATGFDDMDDDIPY